MRVLAYLKPQLALAKNGVLSYILSKKLAGGGDDGNLFDKNNYIRYDGYLYTDWTYVAGEGRITAVLPNVIPAGTYKISRATSARLRAGLVRDPVFEDGQLLNALVSGTNNSDSPIEITVPGSGFYLAIFFKDTSDPDEQVLVDALRVEAVQSE